MGPNQSVHGGFDHGLGPGWVDRWIGLCQDLERLKQARLSARARKTAAQQIVDEDRSSPSPLAKAIASLRADTSSWAARIFA